MNPSSPSNAPDENAPNENSSDENAGDAALAALLDPAPESAPDSSAESREKTRQDAPLTAPVEANSPDVGGPPALDKLDEATRDLLMPSESDEPFRTVYWPLEKDEITSSEVALYLTENADAKVETQSVEQFFRNAVLVEDWMDDEEQATAKRFQSLVETLYAELGEPRVYLVGERERTTAIIGKVAGGFAGVVTLVVET